MIAGYVMSNQPKDAGISSDEFAYGNTKIFVKSPETIFIMSEMLEQKIDPEGYKQKMLQLKQVEKLAEKQKKKAMGGLKTQCIVM